MKRRYIFLKVLIVIAVFIAFTISCSNQKSFNYLGTWKPVKHVECDIFGLSESAITKLMNSKVSLNEKTFDFFEEKTINPKYSIHKENTTNFINNNYKIDSKKLGIIKDSVDILTVDFSINDPMPSIDFIIFEDKMIVNNDGVFFFLEKI